MNDTKKLELIKEQVQLLKRYAFSRRADILSLQVIIMNINAILEGQDSFGNEVGDICKNIQVMIENLKEN